MKANWLTKVVLGLGLVTVVLAQNASAATVTLHSNNFYASLGGVGNGRGIGLHADSTFTMTSLGIFGDLINQSFDAQVYSSSNGHDIGGLLASSSAVVGGSGSQYYDIALDFTFNAGDFYTILWRPTATSSSWANSIDYYNDSGLPLTIDAFTLLDGTEGYTGVNFSNFLHPNLRLNAVDGGNQVPEPASVALLAVALLGLASARRSKKA